MFPEGVLIWYKIDFAHDKQGSTFTGTECNYLRGVQEIPKQTN
jgi:hypothetical protein